MRQKRLCDLGEDRIVDDLIVPRFPAVGYLLGGPDDCAVLPLDTGGMLVHSADPCPAPVVYNLFDRDPYHYGWLVVTINASDIAAMGASPAQMLLLIEAPGDMPVRAFKRLLDGVCDAAADMKLDVAGGNIRDATELRLQATMLGRLASGLPLQRSALTPGQTIWALGHNGHFWASALLCLSNGYEPSCREREVHRALCRPQAKVAIGRELQQSGMCAAATDASDGVMSAIECLAKASKMDVNVRLERAEPDSWLACKSAELCVDPLICAFAWGDWQLVVAVDSEDENMLVDMAHRHGLGALRCGEVAAPGPGCVGYSRNGTQIAPPDLRSKKFSADNEEDYRSWADLIRKARFK